MDNELDIVKKKLRKQANEEAGRRILSKYPYHKQLNALAFVMRLQNRDIVSLKSGNNSRLSSNDRTLINTTSDMDSWILSVRRSCGNLRNMINCLTHDETLSFNVCDDTHWR